MMADTFEIKLEKMVYGGDCLGRLPDRRAVFVPFALPGEIVRVELLADKKHYARGWPVELVEASPDRISPRCRHFGACGGCQYQHLDYAKQLPLKESILKDQFQRIADLDDPLIQPIIASPNPWNYRNHVQFHLGGQGELGYIHADGEYLQPIQECHLPEHLINEIWPQLEFSPESGVQHLGVRVDSYDEILLTLEGTAPEAPAFSVDTPISAVYTPPEADLTVLAGDDHLTYSVMGQHFQVSARSFFQVNTPLVEEMIQFLLKQLPLTQKMHIIELYAGVGLFSAFIAPKVGHLTAVESSGSACHDFAVNLDIFENVTLYEAEAEEVLPALEIHPDVLIMDPPRAGLANAVVDAIGKLLPDWLAYISCDPATLARDVKKLGKNGYRLDSVTPFDLFPHTAHIESITLLSRQGDG